LWEPIRREADGPALGSWLNHQFANGIKHDLELPVVLALQRGKLLRQIVVA
jgi:hypothetical protein